MRSESGTPSDGARPSNSFSVPLCVKYRRDFMLMIVSPMTLKRKCPGSMTPACTGPTGISKTPSPPTGVNGKGRPSSAKTGGGVSSFAQRAIVLGPERVPDEGAEIGVAGEFDADQVP